MKTLAIDQSLTCSGYAYMEGTTLKVGRIMPKALKGVQRLSFIERVILDLFDESKADSLIMEGYAMGARGRVFNLGELGGVIKLAAFAADIPVLVVPPSTLKKWVTGKGNAKKEVMIAAVKKKWYKEVSSDDVADAVALYYFGELYYEHAGKRRKSREIRDMIGRCEVEQ